ncbi:MAG: hypothetical protein IT223_12760 [Crocinitomicaceae bacterium]|nr:hypothetical protein [Crocinitomicaceae bacterium]
MNELKNKYIAMKQQSIEMMQSGNISAYLAKLVAIHDVRIQMIQLTSEAEK